MILAGLFAQLRWGGDLMRRQHAYAASIGCTTYDEGALYDSIEVHTEEQASLLAAWWAANTTGATK